MRNGTRYAAYAVDEKLELVSSRALKAWNLPYGLGSDKKTLEAATAWAESYVTRHPEVGVEVWIEEFVDQERDWRDLEWRTFGETATARIAEWEKAEAEAGR